MTSTTGATEQAAAAVSALFVPADRPERFAKAAAAGAGVVIIDLEDAVAASAKAGALSMALKGINLSDRNPATVRALIRLNQMGSAEHDVEVHELLAAAKIPGSGLLGFVLSKAEDPEALRNLRKTMPAHLALVPLVESAEGLVNSLEMARIPGVTRLAFGAIDYALDLNSGSGDRFLDHARAQLVLVSRAAGIAAPLDSPSTHINDGEKVRESALLARNFGFGGKLCIHPNQVNVVHAAFRPTPSEIEWATTVLATSPGGASQIKGQMIDRPVIARAQRIMQSTNKEQ